MASAEMKSEALSPRNWRLFADEANLHPIRGELLGAERLEAHARKLGALLAGVELQVGRPLLQAFQRNARILQEAHRIISDAYRNDEPLGNDAEWLLDNYHIISDALTEIRTDLPSGYYVRLPKIAAGPLAGYPRVYALALDLATHCDSSMDEGAIVQFVQAFQESAPLTIGEIWAVPIMLRLCMIENLRRLAEHIVHCRVHRQRAQAWIARKLTALKDASAAEAFEIAAIHADWRDCYVVHLLEGLHDHAAIHPEGIENLEKTLAGARDTPTDVLRREKERQAANQVSIGNCVTTLRLLSALDWAKFFEKTSRLEAALRGDPAGVYARQDFATRDHYRSIVEKLAYCSKTSELAVAERILQMAQAAPTADQRRRHVGYYLIDEGMATLQASLRYRAPLTEWLPRTLLAYPHVSYFGGVAGLVLAGLLALAWGSHALGATPLGIAVLVLATVIPVTGLAVELLNFVVVALLPPRTLPALDFKAGVPADCATYIVIPTMLGSDAGATGLVERLEIHYLANAETNIYFALLTDFADAYAEEMPDDAHILRTAADGIRHLNEKYCADGSPLFFLLHRRRQWNAAQNCWMGWERKRGKLAEFNRLLRGARDTSFTTVGNDWNTLPRIRFVITLDTDTQLPRETARRLIAMLAHPLNQPEYDPEKRRVVRGHAVLQPRIGFSMRAAHGSFFARLFSGSAGLDPYTTAVSDIYQDLFERGSFTGKGIYDVDSFEAATGPAFPDNHILSHDLIEGNYARCGLATNIELLDDFPANYLAFARRAHRWVRGDWQILAWLFPWAPGPGGTTVRNPLPLLERWKIFDNLRRSLTPAALVALLVLGWTVLPGSSWGWTALAALVIANPLLLQLLDMLARSIPNVLRGKAASFNVRDLGFTAGQVALTAIFLAAEALSTLDAIVRTLGRLWLTKHRLLEWETAAAAERRLQGGLGGFVAALWPASALAAALALLVAWVRPEALIPAAPFLLGWLLSPVVAFVVSRPTHRTPQLLTTNETLELRRLARKTWAFFETYVGVEDHWLPPDNYQEDPKNEVAHRTSPTNIGLYLLSCVAAHDLGFITLPTLIDRLEKTLATMERMERSHGHLYNWYDTQKLEPLRPLYLSTVDSGNLVACLLTLKQSLLEKIDRPIVDAAAAHGMQDAAALLRASIRELEDPAERGGDIGAAFEPLLHTVLSSLETPAGSLAEWSDRLGRVVWERALLEKKAEHLNALLAEAPEEVRRWTAILADLVHARQAELAGIHEVLTGIDTPIPFDRLTLRQLAQAHYSSSPNGNGKVHSAWADNLLRRCQNLADQANEMAAAMDFKVLYNAPRSLFAVGYNQSLGRLDGSHYDLLASEASLTSFLAIARREAPRKHWFHLGRPLTEAAGNRVLISWGGTMFEYLMPRLLLAIEPETLLGETQAGAVAVQIAYGRQCGTPWGISESAFSAVDGQLNYQYQAFGAPALGLKRGLGKDLVVAPYATGLAFMIEPRLALANLHRLAKEGADGEFGWYEAIDYTAERLPKGQRLAVVKCYMAHHQGMTLLALTNCLLGNPLPRRFRAEPMVRATELLLQERVPNDVPLADLQPADVVQATFHEVPTQLSRRVTTPHTALPRTHLLASAQCSVMVTAAGSGFSAARGLAITRWREDSACDCFGQFYYLRDLTTGQAWSAGYQPLAKEADAYEVTFATDKVEFHRRDDKLETRMEITVAPGHHAEVRRLTVVNHDDRPHEVEWTSYVEVALLPQGADVAHPAFGKLFLETEYVRESGALLCRRRPRAADDKPVWCVHVMAAEDPALAPVQYETDRARFLGRGRSPARPAALDTGAAPLSGTVGAVLDPILSLRRRFRIAAGAAVHVAFTTALADTRADALGLAETCKELHAIHRAFELAWAHTQVELRQQHWTAAETHLFQRLAAHLFFAGKALRAAPALVASNRQGQTDLWRLGLSGDLPIVLVRIGAADELPLARQVEAAHTFWRLKGLFADLVFLNENGGTYFEELDQQLQLLVRASDDRARVDKPGGVFLRKSAHLGQADLLLLQAAARCVLVGSRGPLGVQLDRLERVRGEARGEGRGASQKTPRSPAVASRQAPAPLLFENGIGGFSADGKEYVLRLVKRDGRHVLPPLPWVNVIANANFGFLVSESGAGSTWADNSQAHRLSPWHNDPISDPPGEVVYLRDEATGVFWSATPQPCGAGAAFTVRHGQGYSIFEHERGQLACKLTLFVAPDEPLKFFKLTIRNLGAQPRRLAAIFYAELVLGTHRGRNAAHVVTEIDAETQMLLARNRWDADFKDKIAFADVNQRPRGVTADRTEFIGRNGSLASPAACERGQLAGAVGACIDPCAALQTAFVLRPQEEQEIVFVLGEANRLEEVRRLARIVQDASQVQARWDGAVGFWNRLTGSLTIKTPDAALDLLVNRWLPYQVLSCRMWGRSALYQSGGAFGFRDQLQDGLALIYARPEETRRHLVRAAGRQFLEGDVQHWWHVPSGAGVRTRISDDFLWLPFAVHHYVVTTGDAALLDEQVTFLEAPLLAPGQDEDYRMPTVSAQVGTIYEHCLRAIAHGCRYGVHDLPLMGTGDWNDGMNRVGIEGRGESVWLGWFLLVVLRNFADLCEQRGDADHAESFRREADRLRGSMEQNSWDGQWYRRAYFDDGRPLGSAANDECRIDSLPQSWAVLAGAADAERARTAMKAVNAQLVRRDARLVLLFTPPFDGGELQPGYIKGYVPGIRENGGQYTHAATWVAQAWALLGDADRALEILDLINPILHTDNPTAVARYRLEPYVLAGDVYGKAPHEGRGGWSWYTGSASWYYRVVIETLLGFELRGQQLRLQPRLPTNWPGAELTFRFRSASYAIKIERSGTSSRSLDGKPWAEEMFPLQDDGKEHTIVLAVY
jgi:cyclic beta-1,2-glucan synthetase